MTSLLEFIAERLIPDEKFSGIKLSRRQTLGLVCSIILLVTASLIYMSREQPGIQKTPWPRSDHHQILLAPAAND